ncbi:MAG: hypothetical protein GY860_26190 [Desulfobacteraceae bacterium]|nr:hypothetical protein [Desulfobacteraceae bacterium]
MMQDQAKTVIQQLLNGTAQISSTGGSADTQSQIPVPPQESQTGDVLKQDAKDVGQAARQETKDATVDEVKEGVRSIFKSFFD